MENQINSKDRLIFLHFLLNFVVFGWIVVFKVLSMNFLHDLNLFFNTKLKFNLQVNSGSYEVFEDFLAVGLSMVVLKIDEEVLQVVIHVVLSLGF